MQKVLKDNIVLVFGISLPILLVIIFILAGTLPKFFVANPQYDFLFSDLQPYGSQLEFVVIDQKVNLRTFPDRPSNGLPIPHIYRYVAATGKVQEIPFTLPDISMQKNPGISNGVNTNVVVSVDPNHLPSAEQARDASKVVAEMGVANKIADPLVTPVAELSGMRIDSNAIAPDEYRFIGANDRYNGGLFFSGLGYSARERDPIIAKSGKTIPVLYNHSRGGGYYSYPVFIGWIIP